MSAPRTWAVLLLVVATATLTRAAHPEAPPVRAALGVLPYQLATWTGRDAPALDAETVRVLAADAYLTRRYTGAAAVPVDLYIAYYGRQQPGVSIHSPLNCLPGTGWEPLDVVTRDIARADGAPGHVRRLVVRKNLARAVVLYWYSIHGRMLAGEVASRLWLLHDSVRLRRSDATLIRIVVPVSDDGPDGVDAAERQGLAFTRDLLPFLPALWI